MMRAIWSGLRSHRGGLTALVLVGLGLVAWSRPPRPRASWVEPRVGPTGERDWVVVKFSPDGRSLLTWNGAGARVRDVTSGRVVEPAADEFRAGHPVQLVLQFMDYLAKGRLLYGQLGEVGPANRGRFSLRVWETTSGRELARFPDIGLPSATPTIDVSADGSTLAVLKGATGPTSVTVWKDVEGWRPRVFPAGPDQVVSLSADGRFLAAAVAEPPAAVAVWEVASGRRSATLALGPGEWIGPLALSPDGRTLAMSQNRGTILFDLADPARRQVLATATRDLPRFSPDGSILSLGVPSTVEQDAEIWDLAARPPRRVFLGQVVAISHDGRRIVRAGPNKEPGARPELPTRDRDIPRVVEVPSMKIVSRVSPWDRVLTFSPDDRTLATICHRFEWHWAATVLRRLPIPFRFRRPPDLRPVSEVRVIEAESGRQLAAVDIADRVTPMESEYRMQYEPLCALSLDGKTLAIHCPDPARDSATPGFVPTVELWDVPARPSRWPIVGALTAVALIVGRWYDVRERRRAAPALA